MQQSESAMDQFAALDQELAGGEGEQRQDSELETSAEALDKIDALLNGTEPEKPAKDDGEAPDTDAKGESNEPQGDAEDDTDPLTEGDESASEELAADEAENEVNWDQEIPMPDGFENLTLGGLKDIATNAARSQAEVIEKEILIVQERDDISQLLETLGQFIPREALPQIKALDQKYKVREQALLLEAIPEWTDPLKKAADGDIMLALVKTYGVTERQFKSIGDYRMLKFIRNMALDKQALETARLKLVPSKTVKRKRPVRRASQRASASLDKTLSEAKASSSQSVKLAAMDQLLGR